MDKKQEEIPRSLHWLYAPLRIIEKNPDFGKLYFNRIFIGHIDTVIGSIIAKYFAKRRSKFCLPIIPSKADEKLKTPSHHPGYFKYRNPRLIGDTDFKGRYEDLTYLWFRESSAKVPCCPFWDVKNPDKSLAMYSLLYKRVFRPKISDDIELNNLGIITCSKNFKQLWLKFIGPWKSDYFDPNSNLVLEKWWLDDFMRLDPKQKYIENMVLEERIKAMLKAKKHNRTYKEKMQNKLEYMNFLRPFYEVYGTQCNRDVEFKNSHILGYVKVAKGMPAITWKFFNEYIFPCPVIIYNIASTAAERIEARTVINMLLIKLIGLDDKDRLKAQSLYGFHTFVVISSITTWSNTSQVLGEIIKLEEINESLVHKRVPHDESKEIYDLECYFLDLAEQYKDFLKIIVIGSGVVYGRYGQRTPFTKSLTNYFLQSLVRGRIDIIGSGKNHLPAIHIKDLLSIIHNAIIFMPRGMSYMIACEKKIPTQHAILSTLKEKWKKQFKKVVPLGHCGSQQLGLGVLANRETQFLKQFLTSTQVFPLYITDHGCFHIKKNWKLNMTASTLEHSLLAQRLGTRIVLLGPTAERRIIADALSKHFGLPMLTPTSCIERLLQTLVNIEYDFAKAVYMKLMSKIFRARQITLMKLTEQKYKIKKLRLLKALKSITIRTHNRETTYEKFIYLRPFDAMKKHHKQKDFIPPMSKSLQQQIDREMELDKTEQSRNIEENILIKTKKGERYMIPSYRSYLKSGTFRKGESSNVVSRLPKPVQKLQSYRRGSRFIRGDEQYTTPQLSMLVCLSGRHTLCPCKVCHRYYNENRVPVVGKEFTCQGCQNKCTTCGKSRKATETDEKGTPNEEDTDSDDTLTEKDVCPTCRKSRNATETSEQGTPNKEHIDSDDTLTEEDICTCGKSRKRVCVCDEGISKEKEINTDDTLTEEDICTFGKSRKRVCECDEGISKEKEINSDDILTEEEICSTSGKSRKEVYGCGEGTSNNKEIYIDDTEENMCSISGKLRKEVYGCGEGTSNNKEIYIDDTEENMCSISGKLRKEVYGCGEGTSNNKEIYIDDTEENMCSISGKLRKEVYGCGEGTSNNKEIYIDDTEENMCSISGKSRKEVYGCGEGTSNNKEIYIDDTEENMCSISGKLRKEVYGCGEGTSNNKEIYIDDTEENMCSISGKSRKEVCRCDDGTSTDKVIKNDETFTDEEINNDISVYSSILGSRGYYPKNSKNVCYLSGDVELQNYSDYNNTLNRSYETVKSSILENFKQLKEIAQKCKSILISNYIRSTISTELQSHPNSCNSLIVEENIKITHLYDSSSSKEETEISKKLVDYSFGEIGKYITINYFPEFQKDISVSTKTDIVCSDTNYDGHHFGFSSLQKRSPEIFHPTRKTAINIKNVLKEDKRVIEPNSCIERARKSESAKHVASEERRSDLRDRIKKSLATLFFSLFPRFNPLRKQRRSFIIKRGEPEEMPGFCYPNILFRRKEKSDNNSFKIVKKVTPILTADTKSHSSQVSIEFQQIPSVQTSSEFGQVSGTLVLDSSRPIKRNKSIRTKTKESRYSRKNTIVNQKKIKKSRLSSRLGRKYVKKRQLVLVKKKIGEIKRKKKVAPKKKGLRRRLKRMIASCKPINSKNQILKEPDEFALEKTIKCLIYLLRKRAFRRRKNRVYLIREIADCIKKYNRLTKVKKNVMVSRKVGGRTPIRGKPTFIPNLQKKFVKNEPIKYKHFNSFDKMINHILENYLTYVMYRQCNVEIIQHFDVNYMLHQGSSSFPILSSGNLLEFYADEFLTQEWRCDSIHVEIKDNSIPPNGRVALGFENVHIDLLTGMWLLLRDKVENPKYLGLTKTETDQLACKIESMIYDEIKYCKTVDLKKILECLECLSSNTGDTIIDYVLKQPSSNVDHLSLGGMLCVANNIAKNFIYPFKSEEKNKFMGLKDIKLKLENTLINQQRIGIKKQITPFMSRSKFAKPKTPLYDYVYNGLKKEINNIKYIAPPLGCKWCAKSGPLSPSYDDFMRRVYKMFAKWIINITKQILAILSIFIKRIKFELKKNHSLSGQTLKECFCFDIPPEMQPLLKAFIESDPIFSREKIKCKSSDYRANLIMANFIIRLIEIGAMWNVNILTNLNGVFNYFQTKRNLHENPFSLKIDRNQLLFCLTTAFDNNNLQKIKNNYQLENNKSNIHLDSDLSHHKNKQTNKSKCFKKIYLDSDLRHHKTKQTNKSKCFKKIYLDSDLSHHKNKQTNKSKCFKEIYLDSDLSHHKNKQTNKSKCFKKIYLDSDLSHHKNKQTNKSKCFKEIYLDSDLSHHKNKQTNKSKCFKEIYLDSDLSHHKNKQTNKSKCFKKIYLDSDLSHHKNKQTNKSKCFKEIYLDSDLSHHKNKQTNKSKCFKEIYLDSDLSHHKNKQTNKSKCFKKIYLDSDLSHHKNKQTNKSKCFKEIYLDSDLSHHRNQQINVVYQLLNNQMFSNKIELDSDLSYSKKSPNEIQIHNHLKDLYFNKKLREKVSTIFISDQLQYIIDITCMHFIGRPFIHYVKPALEMLFCFVIWSDQEGFISSEQKLSVKPIPSGIDKPRLHSLPSLGRKSFRKDAEDKQKKMERICSTGTAKTAEKENNVFMHSITLLQYKIAKNCEPVLRKWFSEKLDKYSPFSYLEVKQILAKLTRKVEDGVFHFLINTLMGTINIMPWVSGLKHRSERIKHVELNPKMELSQSHSKKKNPFFLSKEHKTYPYVIHKNLLSSHKYSYDKNGQIIIPNIEKSPYRNKTTKEIPLDVKSQSQKWTPSFKRETLNTTRMGKLLGCTCCCEPILPMQDEPNISILRYSEISSKPIPCPCEHDTDENLTIHATIDLDINDKEILRIKEELRKRLSKLRKVAYENLSRTKIDWTSKAKINPIETRNKFPKPHSNNYWNTNEMLYIGFGETFIKCFFPLRSCRHVIAIKPILKNIEVECIKIEKLRRKIEQLKKRNINYRKSSILKSTSSRATGCSLTDPSNPIKFKFHFLGWEVDLNEKKKYIFFKKLANKRKSKYADMIKLIENPQDIYRTKKKLKNGEETDYEEQLSKIVPFQNEFFSLLERRIQRAEAKNIGFYENLLHALNEKLLICKVNFWNRITDQINALEGYLLENPTLYVSTCTMMVVNKTLQTLKFVSIMLDLDTVPLKQENDHTENRKSSNMKRQRIGVLGMDDGHEIPKEYDTENRKSNNMKRQRMGIPRRDSGDKKSKEYLSENVLKNNKKISSTMRKTEMSTRISSSTDFRTSEYGSTVFSCVCEQKIPEKKQKIKTEPRIFISSRGSVTGNLECINECELTKKSRSLKKGVKKRDINTHKRLKPIQKSLMDKKRKYIKALKRVSVKTERNKLSLNIVRKQLKIARRINKINMELDEDILTNVDEMEEKIRKKGLLLKKEKLEREFRKSLHTASNMSTAMEHKKIREALNIRRMHNQFALEPKQCRCYKQLIVPVTSKVSNAKYDEEVASNIRKNSLKNNSSTIASASANKLPGEVCIAKAHGYSVNNFCSQCCSLSGSRCLARVCTCQESEYYLTGEAPENNINFFAEVDEMEYIRKKRMSQIYYGSGISDEEVSPDVQKKMDDLVRKRKNEIIKGHKQKRNFMLSQEKPKGPSMPLIYRMNQLNLIRRVLRTSRKMEPSFLAEVVAEAINDPINRDVFENTGYILDGFPVNAHDAGILFSYQPAVCRCKWMECECDFPICQCSINCPCFDEECDCNPESCSCDTKKCSCKERIEIDKKLLPTHVFVAVPKRTTVYQVPKLLYKNKKITAAWMEEFKFWSRLRTRRGSSISFFEDLNLPIMYFSLEGNDAVYQATKKMILAASKKPEFCFGKPIPNVNFTMDCIKKLDESTENEKKRTSMINALKKTAEVVKNEKNIYIRQVPIGQGHSFYYLASIVIKTKCTYLNIIKSITSMMESYKDSTWKLNGTRMETLILELFIAEENDKDAYDALYGLKRKYSELNLWEKLYHKTKKLSRPKVEKPTDHLGHELVIDIDKCFKGRGSKNKDNHEAEKDLIFAVPEDFFFDLRITPKGPFSIRPLFISNVDPRSLYESQKTIDVIRHISYEGVKKVEKNEDKCSITCEEPCRSPSYCGIKILKPYAHDKWPINSECSCESKGSRIMPKLSQPLQQRIFGPRIGIGSNISVAGPRPSRKSRVLKTLKKTKRVSVSKTALAGSREIKSTTKRKPKEIKRTRHSEKVKLITARKSKRITTQENINMPNYNKQGKPSRIHKSDQETLKTTQNPREFQSMRILMCLIQNKQGKSSRVRISDQESLKNPQKSKRISRSINALDGSHELKSSASPSITNKLKREGVSRKTKLKSTVLSSKSQLSDNVELESQSQSINEKMAYNIFKDNNNEPSRKNNQGESPRVCKSDQKMLKYQNLKKLKKKLGYQRAIKIATVIIHPKKKEENVSKLESLPKPESIANLNEKCKIDQKGFQQNKEQLIKQYLPILKKRVQILLSDLQLSENQRGLKLDQNWNKAYFMKIPVVSKATQFPVYHLKSVCSKYIIVSTKKIK